MTRAALLALALLTAGCAGTPDDHRPPAASGLQSLRLLADRVSPNEDSGTVDLVIAADAAFLEFHGGDTARVLQEAVATLDRVLGAETGVKFRIGRATVFASTPGVRDDLRLLWEARLRVPRGGADVVVAFTGQDCGPRAGIAEPQNRLVLCAEPSDPERSLLHEMSHLFGARDHGRRHPGYDVPSVMSYNSDLPRTLAFDSVNVARLRANAGRLPAVEDDGVTAALVQRTETLSGGAPAALVGSFLCAESRRSQRAGLAAAEILLETIPDDPVAAWIYGECLRVEKDVDGARALFLMALQGVAGLETLDALDRHVTLEMANLVVDDVDGTGVLSDAAEKALHRVAAAFPDDLRVRGVLGSFRLRANDFSAARTAWKSVVEEDPSAAWAWRLLGTLARSTNDPDLWLEAWRGFRAADPPDPAAGVRWVAEGLRAFPRVLRFGPARDEVLDELRAAIAAFPEWEEPKVFLVRLSS